MGHIRHATKQYVSWIVMKIQFGAKVLQLYLWGDADGNKKGNFGRH